VRGYLQGRGKKMGKKRENEIKKKKDMWYIWRKRRKKRGKEKRENGIKMKKDIWYIYREEGRKGGREKLGIVLGLNGEVF
jgi:hypothetical protein